MSSISFDTKTRRATLKGAERYHMAGIVNRLTSAALNVGERFGHASWTRRLLPEGEYVLKMQGEAYVSAFTIWLSVDGQGMRHPVTGQPVDAFAMSLNTTLRLGSDEVRLLARLHGQCEIHAFIPPEDCEFIARLIDSGRASGLYREGMGWEDVAKLLREAGAAGETVVTSFSVTESFPGWDSETEERKDWDEALAALSPSLAMSAANWSTYYFRDGVTAMSLEADAHRKTLEEKPSPASPVPAENS